MQATHLNGLMSGTDEFEKLPGGAGYSASTKDHTDKAGNSELDDAKTGQKPSSTPDTTVTAESSIATLQPKDTRGTASHPSQQSEVDDKRTLGEETVGEEEEEEEPRLKYQRLGSSVTDILSQDAASCLCVSDKLMALGTHDGTVHVLDYAGNEVGAS